jgi:carbon-monoxide dehydrogenase small subunit
LGKGTYINDAETQKGNLSGGGIDKNGQSRVSGEMHYAVAEKDPTTSHVDVELRFIIEGPLAQFNRPELVTGFVDFLLQRFVRNCDAMLSGKAENVSNGVGVFSVLWAVVRSWFKRRSS